MTYFMEILLFMKIIRPKSFGKGIFGRATSQDLENMLKRKKFPTKGSFMGDNSLEKEF